MGVGAQVPEFKVAMDKEVTDCRTLKPCAEAVACMVAVKDPSSADCSSWLDKLS